MKAMMLLVTGLLLVGAVAVPASAAEPGGDPPPGFGRCELKEETYGEVHVGDDSYPISLPTRLECYW